MMNLRIFGQNISAFKNALSREEMDSINLPQLRLQKKNIEKKSDSIFIHVIYFFIWADSVDVWQCMSPELKAEKRMITKAWLCQQNEEISSRSYWYPRISNFTIRCAACVIALLSYNIQECPFYLDLT